MGREQADYEACCDPDSPSEPPSDIADKGLKNYWRTRNLKSLDGLPAMMLGYSSSARLGNWNDSSKGAVFRAMEDDEREAPLEGGTTARAVISTTGADKLILGFGVGVLTGLIISKWATMRL